MSELDYTDVLAAEYVLGTLDFEERTQARALLDADEAFAAKVELWERRFGELHHMVEPVEPEAAIWARIKAKMPEARLKMQSPAPEVPPPAFAPAASEPPSLDAIQAAISQAATTLTSEANSARAMEPSPAPISEGMQMRASEATPAPASEVTPAPVSEATPAPASEATLALASEPAPISDVPLVLTPQATPTAAIEPVSPAPVVPPAAAALEVPSEARTLAGERATAAVHRRMRRWRAFAILMTLVVAAVAALLAAWTFAPDRVPPMLQPVELLRQIGVPLPSGPAPRRPAPPGSQFDE